MRTFLAQQKTLSQRKEARTFVMAREISPLTRSVFGLLRQQYSKRCICIKDVAEAENLMRIQHAHTHACEANGSIKFESNRIQ